MHRERAPDRAAHLFGGYSPHAFAPDWALTKIAGMTRDRAADSKLGEVPGRGTLGGRRAPQRNYRASDGRRDMHRAGVGTHRDGAFGKDRDQIAQRGSS